MRTLFKYLVVAAAIGFGIDYLGIRPAVGGAIALLGCIGLLFVYVFKVE